jgi:hypothetical protein
MKVTRLELLTQQHGVTSQETWVLKLWISSCFCERAGMHLTALYFCSYSVLFESQVCWGFSWWNNSANNLCLTECSATSAGTHTSKHVGSCTTGSSVAFFGFLSLDCYQTHVQKEGFSKLTCTQCDIQSTLSFVCLWWKECLKIANIWNSF